MNALSETNSTRVNRMSVRPLAKFPVLKVFIDLRVSQSAFVSELFVLQEPLWKNIKA